MKKIFYLLITLLLISTASCKKYLQEENLSGITAQNYYKDAKGFESLVNACYASLKPIYSTNPALFEWGTDLTTRGESELVSGVSNEPPAIQINEYRALTADNSYVSNFFTRSYSGIQICNTAINTAGNIPDLTPAQKDRRIAEVKFIRAYFYYLLVENFGAIPLVQEQFTAPVTRFEPNTEQQIYEFMISEINAALPSLSVNPTQVETGRVTQAAAKHFLSLLHLTRGYKTFAVSTDFEKSALLAEEVIANTSYALQPTFAEVFRSGNERNREIVFAVQYEPLPGGAGNGQNILFGWRLWREKGFDETSSLKDYNRRSSEFMPTQFLYTLYNTTADARYDVTFLSRFFATKADVLGTSAVKVGDLRFFFPYPDQPFSAADEAALKVANPNVQVIRFDQWKQAFAGIGGAEKFPMINKFYDPTAALPGSSSENLYTGSKDVFLFRLAETYLIAAEAYFKSGMLGKSADKLNAVRQRAAKSGQSLSITAAEVNIDFILDERARELAGEYKRWFDLKRTRRLERAFSQNILTKNANPAGVLDKYYLRPIPQIFIDRNTGGYPQNNGY
ncbi:RagB/SusD family nutrient uptake outer membrane protein [Pedobacter rhizosphaerae]|uniref:Starch-binding associating with outer membrane n=1 Tax=Pedobacter rhizosphaerae TaxID=390241 RepID=A0A1H9VQY0_9SPHI|nr:RagB/SusD family nutrient uptake outer membrane protein [Pedobacter rhizosphaerae]SES23931.1 Starch-binding associating with outer membrane [Pedobacter rhizosphaerae]